MTTLQLLIISLTVIVGLVIVAAGRQPTATSDEPVELGAVLLYTRTDQSVRAAGAQVNAHDVTLRDAAFVTGETTQSIPGVVRVPRGNVALIQEL